jgi:ribosomal protein L7/L12
MNETTEAWRDLITLEDMDRETLYNLVLRMCDEVQRLKTENSSLETSISHVAQEVNILRRQKAAFESAQEIVDLKNYYSGEAPLQKIPMIKILRAITGVGLKEAKEFIESVELDSPRHLELRVVEVKQLESYRCNEYRIFLKEEE